MNKPSECPVCKNKDFKIMPKPGRRLAFLIDCKYCGKFLIGGTYLHSDLSKFGERYTISGTIRNLYEKGQKIELFHEGDFKKILDSVKIPQGLFEKIDLLIKYINRKTEHLGAGVKIKENLDYPVLYSEDYLEFQHIIIKAVELGYIEFDTITQGYRLALGGWERLKELLKKEIKSNQAFVAMWFNSSLDEAWEDGFKVALEETGYEPLRIDLKEHNEKICDIIIAEIQDSGLLIADFTGQRGNVYFEAGFAKGLGIPVIWTCKKGDEKGLRFDTRQYNHIIWEKPEDLKKQLINRIRATLPKIQ
jgi:nucleoside 2-deoxyribosyltransferase